MLVRLARSVSVRGRARQSLGPSFDRLGWMAPLSWASLIFGLAMTGPTAGVALAAFPTPTNNQDAGVAESTLLSVSYTHLTLPPKRESDARAVD